MGQLLLEVIDALFGKTQLVLHVVSFVYHVFEIQANLQTLSTFMTQVNDFLLKFLIL